MSCVKYGDAIRVAEPTDKLDTHTWFVMSDPAKNPDRVLLLNMTSYGNGVGKDSTCILEPSDHSCITRKSCIKYGQPRRATAVSLHTLCQGGLITNLGHIGSPMLNKILAGCAGKASDLANGYRTLLAEQGLIDL